MSDIAKEYLEGLRARIAELEGANKICRRDIEALMSSADKLETGNAWLEARNTDLEAEIVRDRDWWQNAINQAAAQIERLYKRIAELEAEIARLTAERAVANCPEIARTPEPEERTAVPSEEKT